MAPPTPLQNALESIASCEAQAGHAGVFLRPPPPQPTSCCGRGCNGCVWDGYFAAVGWWLEDAQAALAERRAPAVLSVVQSAAQPAAPGGAG